MKEQVKSRMEELLNLEVQHRRASATQTRQTGSADAQTRQTVSADVQTRQTGSTDTQTGLAGSSTTSKLGGRVEAKADLLFNMDTGTLNFMPYREVVS